MSRYHVARHYTFAGESVKDLGIFKFDYNVSPPCLTTMFSCTVFRDEVGNLSVLVFDLQTTP